METGHINVQTENIFPIIKKFLYSDTEIFLRELVSSLGNHRPSMLRSLRRLRFGPFVELLTALRCVLMCAGAMFAMTAMGRERRGCGDAGSPSRACFDSRRS